MAVRFCPFPQSVNYFNIESDDCFYVGIGSVQESSPLTIEDVDEMMEEYRRINGNSSSEIHSIREKVQMLRGVITKREEEGKDPACSKQIMYETLWLIRSTPDLDRARQRLNDLVKSLKIYDQSFADRQSKSDGSWGPCFTEWMFKLDQSVDNLLNYSKCKKKLKYPLAFLDRINSPAALRDYLESILVSDPVNTGTDNRKELNYGPLGLLHFFRPGFNLEYQFSEGFKETLFYFINNVWRNPVTGCWGPWYKVGDKIVKMDDLSMTFHVVSYLKGNVPELGKIATTVLAMKEREYPFGWIENGKPSNHHNCDVVLIFNYAWDEMTDLQKEEARIEVRKMVKHCLTNLKNIEPDPTYEESYYFATRFLDVAGYFNLDKNRRYLSEEDTKQVEEVKSFIREKVKKMVKNGSSSPYTKDILEFFDHSFDICKGI